jgi:S-adenosyl methyltransferase
VAEEDVAADGMPLLVPINTNQPSIARVYDAMLGGKDNYAVDRQIREQMEALAPEFPTIGRDNREWLIRVSRFLAGEVGISQFLDCGSGLPTAENTHQVVQRLNRDAVVVYVDNDPTVAAHGRAILAENDHTHFCVQDVTHPAQVLADPVVRRQLDWTEPIALFMIAILHHFDDALRPHELMATYIDALPPGSWVAITHFWNPADGSALAARAKVFEDKLLGGDLGSGRFRTREEIEDFFHGLPLVEPGLSMLPDWWPDGPRTKPLEDARQLILGGLACKS